MLKMGHSAAWLLTARRTVEARKEALDCLELPFSSPEVTADVALDYPPLADAEQILYESAVDIIQTYLQLGSKRIYTRSYNRRSTYNNSRLRSPKFFILRALAQPPYTPI